VSIKKVSSVRVRPRARRRTASGSAAQLAGFGQRAKNLSAAWR
jgi:hypothetical protein